MKPVYFNHDGGVDDLVSLFLLLQMEGIDLIGVSAIGADSYIEPAVSASEKLFNASATNLLKWLLRKREARILSQKSGACMRSS